MKLLKLLWLDQRGGVLSMELILLATVVVVGVLVGLATYRDAMVQEIGDTAAGISRLNQGYTFAAVTRVGAFNGIPFDAAIDGSTYIDRLDFCEPADPDTAGAAPMCITIEIPPAVPTLPINEG